MCECTSTSTAEEFPGVGYPCGAAMMKHSHRTCLPTRIDARHHSRNIRVQRAHFVGDIPSDMYSVRNTLLRCSEGSFESCPEMGRKVGFY